MREPSKPFYHVPSRTAITEQDLKVCTPTAASMPSNKRKLQLESVPRQSKRSATKAVYETTDTGEQITMSYAGWRPSDPSTAEFVRRKYRDVTPKAFWAKYVTQRRPIVLSGGLEHSEFRKLAGWNLDLLEHRAVSFILLLCSTSRLLVHLQCPVELGRCRVMPLLTSR